MAEKKLEGAGLRGQVAGHTALSTVGKAGKGLTYRGYAIEELAEKATFEEVAYLILNKELPNKVKLKNFKKELEANRNITINLREIVKHMPKRSHPMDVARTCLLYTSPSPRDLSTSRMPSSA